MLLIETRAREASPKTNARGGGDLDLNGGDTKPVTATKSHDNGSKRSKEDILKVDVLVARRSSLMVPCHNHLARDALFVKMKKRFVMVEDQWEV